MLAEAIADTMPVTPAEVVFVDLRPSWGVSFYLNAEVEAVLTTRAGAPQPHSLQTVEEELAEPDELEEQRVFVVRADRLEALRAAVAAAGRRIDRTARWGEFAFAELPPAGREASADAHRNG
jgi:hypothetical protein